VRERINKLEQDILSDVEDIRKDLETWKTAGGAVKNLLSSKSTGVINESVGSVVDVLLKKLLLRKTNFVTKFLITFIVKNFARNYLEKNSDAIAHKIKKLVANITHREEETLIE